MSMLPKVRRYWSSMVYRCDRCSTTVTFYLEDGCEGPRTTPTKLRGGDGKLYDWFKTTSGRMVVPVPFVAAGCPKCQPKMPWSIGHGVLQHTGPGDREFPDAMVDNLPVDAGRFLYPRDLTDPRACGEPVLPMFS